MNVVVAVPICQQNCLGNKVGRWSEQARVFLLLRKHFGKDESLEIVTILYVATMGFTFFS